LLRTNSSTLLLYYTHPAHTHTSTLSLHDALPISAYCQGELSDDAARRVEEHLWRCPRCEAEYRQLELGHRVALLLPRVAAPAPRSEEHTSELQSRFDLVCRLLLEKKNESRLCLQH